MGSSMCPHICVIPSTSPEKDAESFQQLFSDYHSEKSSHKSVTLASNKYETIVIFCRAAIIGSLPSVLLLDYEISQLLKDTNGVVEVLPLDNDDFPDKAAAFLRFDGGGTLLVTNQQAVSPSRLADWLTTSSAQRTSGDDDDRKDVTSPENNDSTAPPSKDNSSNGKAIMQEESAHKLPKFPTLDVTLDGAAFPLNAPVPVPIDNDLFQGRILLLVRPPNPAQDDPYWDERIFSKRKRRVRCHG